MAVSDDLASASALLPQAEAPAGQGVPLIATKIRIPRRRPDLLPRQRLVNFCHNHIDRKLILLSAPAGYGKTTLLAEFAHDTDLPVCWYTLDPFDQDLRVFLEYLIASIARRFPAFGDKSRAFLRQVADPGYTLYPIVATMVQEIYDTIHEYFVLILDDHQAVENQEQITEFLDLLITYVDESCHVILASRTLPALPNLSLLVARRQAAGLSIDELRFTPHEIQLLARQNHGLALSLEQAELLAQRTGGWITGLLLTAIPHWGQERADVHLRGRINVDLYDYLSKQVLDQQPAALRDFLLASSVLDEISPELCTAVLRTDQAADLIGQVRSRNLFVTEYEGDDSRLGYHNLFHEFLQSSLRRQDPWRYRELTRRAAKAYADRGEYERAVSRYLALQAFEDVAQIIKQTGEQMFDTGRWDTLAGWIDALPEATCDAYPDFLLQRGRIHAERGAYAPALALFDRAERLFAAAGNQARLAHVLATKGTVLRFQGRYSEAVTHSQQALTTVGGATPHEKAAIALAYKNIGLCQLGLGQVAEGRETLQQALRLYEERGSVHDVAMVHHDLGLSHERAGDLAGAVTHYRAALRSWQQLGSPGPWANTLNGLGVVYYVQGRYDEALPILNEALAKAQQAGDRRVEAYVWASLGDLYRDLGVYRRAQEAYAQALEVAQQAHIGFIITYALDALGNTLRVRGNLTQARAQLLRALEHAQKQESSYDSGLCQLSLGVLAAQEGDLVAARHQLDRAVDLFQASGFPQELARASLHRAYVAFLAGQQEAALADLERALSLAAQLGFDQFLVIEGQWVRPLLGFAIQRGAGSNVLPGILQRIEAHQARLAAQPEPAEHPEPESSIKVWALGQPSVELDGHTVQWPAAQARDLFYLLLRHAQGLRKEQIGEVFWADHPPHKLDGIFRSTLYRLRRALTRQSVLFDDGVYRFNRAGDYWYDVEAFETLLDQAGRSAAPEAVMALLEEALSLYRGDYLEGIYDDWPQLERERLRDRYLSTLATLAALYADAGNLKRTVELYQRLLTEDPYREAAHRELMRCYYQRGDRAAAIRQYQTCAQILREDLGLSPAAETEAVYLRIIS